jgi:rRNA maturation endonuclease Nob1
MKNIASLQEGGYAMAECIICGRALELYEDNFCDSCVRFFKIKYSSTKFLEERIKCHKKNAKRLKQ